MDAIADALVYAVSYINCRTVDEAKARYDDADVGALESIAGFLHSASPTEKDALAAAAERALASEMLMAQPRPEFAEDYLRWMEDMFGEGWRNNKRIEISR